MNVKLIPSPALLQIRECEERDMPVITSIYAEAVRHGSGSFEIDPPDVAEMTKRRKAIVDADYPYLVAQQHDTVVGYCYASLYRARPAYRFSVENSVYVTPEYQGKGVGHLLMKKLIELCEDADFRLMIAVIGDSDNKASIGLHLAHGFKHAGVLPNVGWKFNRWLDSVFMVRELGAGADCPP